MSDLPCKQLLYSEAHQTLYVYFACAEYDGFKDTAVAN